MDERFELADITNNPRKRKKNEAEWKKTKAKQRRNSGEAELAFLCDCELSPM